MSAPIATENCIDFEPANPCDDSRWELATSPGDGATSAGDATYDQYQQSYSGLFHSAGVGDSASSKGLPSDSVDFTPPATSFRLSDIEDHFAGTDNDWQRRKTLHHDTGLDYTGANRSSTMTRWRTDITYCQSIVDLLDVPEYVEEAAVGCFMNCNTRAFNSHYEGNLGASLASAVVYLADTSEEFLESNWYGRLKVVVNLCDASFDAEALVDLAFQKWGGEE